MEEKQISYNQAFEELQTILDDIKQGNIDVDKLATRVKRARELISICEKKIKRAETQVEEITVSLLKDKK